MVTVGVTWYVPTLKPEASTTTRTSAGPKLFNTGTGPDKMTFTTEGAELAAKPGASPITSTGSEIARLESMAAMLTCTKTFGSPTTDTPDGRLKSTKVSKSSVLLVKSMG